MTRENTAQIAFDDFHLYVKNWDTPSSGSACTLVFLHDSLGCVELWRDFPAQLAAAGAAAMAYDRRGYGQSSAMPLQPRQQDYMEHEADVLLRLLDKCGIERPVLFGHSDGGTIALLAAARCPERITAVITEGAHVFVEDITLEGIEKAAMQYATTNLLERLQRYHGDKTQAMFDAWTRTWLAPMYRDWNIEHFLPQIICPVLAIQGAEDEYGTPEQVQAIVRRVSGPAQPMMIVNAGHSPHKQSAQWIITQCCAFLTAQGIL